MKVFTDQKDISPLLDEIAKDNSNVVIVDNSANCDVVISSSPVNEKETIIITETEDDKSFNYLDNGNIKHVIGNSSNLKEELKLSLEFLSLAKACTLENLLEEGSKVSLSPINHSKDTDKVVTELLRSFDFSDYFESPVQYIKLVLNELTSNAFYHQEELLSQDRKESVFNLDNSIVVKVGQDDKKVAISVTDNIGTITKSQIYNSISRGMKERTPRRDTPGAGLGLYMVYQNVNQFYISVDKNEKAEFICIIEKNKRYKKFKERVTSFHYYSREK